jgi:hypothetical protein
MFPPLKKGMFDKTLPKMQRAGWDIGKVLQRYLFTLATDDEKFQ